MTCSLWFNPHHTVTLLKFIENPTFFCDFVCELHNFMRLVKYFSGTIVTEELNQFKLATDYYATFIICVDTVENTLSWCIIKSCK